jgi:2-polyprenyl-3-methyl-5-hydroxy-6-metoxy-1,4-benzoquinol methylase
VGKTVNGREVSEAQVDLIVENIADILRLSEKDALIDLCCGNGLITRQLALIVESVVGVDFTLGLITAARRYSSAPNIEYIDSDVLRLSPKYFSGFKKIVMYEALQHFSMEQSVELVDGLSSLEPGSLVFLGSIPNKERLNAYYDTDEKYAYYVECESEGKPHIGRWWLMEEIARLVSTRGFKATYLSQEPRLYTAYYRFDVLLEKCQ